MKGYLLIVSSRYNEVRWVSGVYSTVGEMSRDYSISTTGKDEILMNRDFGKPEDLSLAFYQLLQDGSSKEIQDPRVFKEDLDLI